MKASVDLEKNYEIINQELNEYLTKAFIDEKKIIKKRDLLPRLVTNNKEKKTKVIDTLKRLLLDCDEFYMSVAFITESGLVLLKQTFDELKTLESKYNKRIKGRILTTDYLTFTEPKALIWLKENTNYEIRIFKTHNNEKDGGFHTKGYFFKKGDLTKILIGSSNLTGSALSKNEEWNTLLISNENGEFLKEASNEFERLWLKAEIFDAYINEYKAIYDLNRGKIFSTPTKKENFKEIITPNKMQEEFLINLKNSIKSGLKRGLLISATGTGKTFAAAFGAKEVLSKNKKVLFIVHNETILKQAIIAFKKVLNKEIKIGLISSNNADKIEGISNINVEKDELNQFDIVFSMKQMIANRLEKIPQDFFDFIIIDEAHKSASEVYLRLIDYFKPEFLLGMTATPERTDDQEKIFNLYYNNILLEVRLKDALDYDFLCPFHYYGITDLEGMDDEKYNLSDFNRLFSSQRIDYILEKSNFYGYSGDRLHGLIFVSRKEDGKELEAKLNERGIKSKFLSGEDSVEEREKSIKALEKDSKDGDYLDFIITINIFNEGIDIPNINQVILLRPTESSIIFIQQLGRGLRKFRNENYQKEFVVVLDFIGNYENNFMIAKALTGEFKGFSDYSTSKLMVASSYIPGISSIEFDEIAREKIFESLSLHRNVVVDDLKKVYLDLRRKLNRIPSYEDFIKYGEIGFDPIYFFKKPANLHSFPEFIQKYFKEDLEKDEFLTKKQLDYMGFLSTNLGFGTRTKEIEFILLQIEENLSLSETLEKIKAKYYEDNLPRFETFKERLIKFLGNATKGTCLINNDLTFKNEFLNELENENFKAKALDLLHYAKSRYERLYKGSYKTYVDNKLVDTGFKLYRQYTRKDVVQILDCGKDQESTVYGYPRNVYRGFLPIFVNLNKYLDENDPTNYSEGFIDEKTFIWSTRNSESLDSKVIKALNNGALVLVFMRVDNIESSHYFLGVSHPELIEKPDDKGIFRYRLSLEKEIDNDILTLIGAKINNENN